MQNAIEPGWLASRFTNASSQTVMRELLTDLYVNRIAILSSFGIESAVILHMASQIDRNIPVLFLDTGHHFEETLSYKVQLTSYLKLESVQIVKADSQSLASQDEEGLLWSSDADACCTLRKVVPLSRALARFDAWISGRKRFQLGARTNLDVFQEDGRRIKVNPLVNWTALDVGAYKRAYNLPEHPLEAKGYRSIGCLPCTSPTRPDEDSRAGRWRGSGKTECGIHLK